VTFRIDVSDSLLIALTTQKGPTPANRLAELRNALAPLPGTSSRISDGTAAGTHALTSAFATLGTPVVLGERAYALASRVSGEPTLLVVDLASQAVSEVALAPLGIDGPFASLALCEIHRARVSCEAHSGRLGWYCRDECRLVGVIVHETTLAVVEGDASSCNAGDRDRDLLSRASGR
jgi:hypothetical protein